MHNHLVVNSVSFENGYKIQMSKKNLQDLKDYSDKLCLEIGASVITKKENTQYIKKMNTELLNKVRVGNLN